MTKKNVVSYPSPYLLESKQIELKDKTLMRSQVASHLASYYMQHKESDPIELKSTVNKVSDFSGTTSPIRTRSDISFPASYSLGDNQKLAGDKTLMRSQIASYLASYYMQHKESDPIELKRTVNKVSEFSGTTSPIRTRSDISFPASYSLGDNQKLAGDNHFMASAE